MKEESLSNLTEVIDFLIKKLSEKEKEQIIKVENMIAYHFSFGRKIRNSLGLWGDSKLKEWFIGIGIFHPDDMSAIILDSLQKTLKNQPVELEKQIKYYQDYWKKMKEMTSSGKGFTVEKTRYGIKIGFPTQPEEPEKPTNYIPGGADPEEPITVDGHIVWVKKRADEIAKKLTGKSDLEVNDFNAKIKEIINLADTIRGEKVGQEIYNKLQELLIGAK